MLRLAGICKTYAPEGDAEGDAGVRALRDISIEIGAGEFVVVTGPSASGKSTLLGILGLLERPTSGTYEWLGEDVAHCPDTRIDELRRDRIGFLFQNFNLVDELTAAENVEMGMIDRGIPPLERKRRTHDALDKVGISPRGMRKAQQFSGGQRQKIAIARVLACAPKLILADEPVGNLDRANAEDIIDLFARTAAGGTTVIVATYTPFQAPFHAGLTQRCIELHEGRIANERRIAA